MKDHVKPNGPENQGKENDMKDTKDETPAACPSHAHTAMPTRDSTVNA